jgi:hypothetical protein
MTGRPGEGRAADPSGPRPGEPNEPGELAETAGRLRAALAEIFGRIGPIGAAFAAQRRACLAAGTDLTPDRLSILAMTIPVLDPAEGGVGDEFLGVAGADIRMSHLEPALLAILRALAAPPPR